MVRAASSINLENPTANIQPDNSAVSFKAFTVTKVKYMNQDE